MSSDPENKVLKTDKELRKKALGLLFASGALGFPLIYILEDFLQRLQKLVEESPDKASEQIGQFLAAFLAIGSLSLLLFSGWVTLLSINSLHTKQFPPPGTRVIRDTRVKFGARACRRAILGLILAAVLATSSVLLPWHGWKLYQMLEISLHAN